MTKSTFHIFYYKHFNHSNHIFQEFKIHSRIKSSVMRPEAECKVMAGGGGVEDAPLINDPTLITHNRSDWNHSETLMWSELRAGLQTVKIHQKLEPLILNQTNVTSSWLKPQVLLQRKVWLFTKALHKLALLKENCDTSAQQLFIHLQTSATRQHVTSMKSVLGLKSAEPGVRSFGQINVFILFLY